ncbi:hypothetical protein PQ465_15390 [Sphingobacterium oryzagri]|uniref:Lipoprotein n=1 Tax=Sphingobacterium oryzagri TaxID=3025669 RepID=A0ABY7WDF6_9SPHI|nr:hypothetical protein [Sphingobacterium sp. KACC 22765]WDF67684.1 hypothetical protein PQ465_15390 [Sphingobacterium sp. KACC 22765]
MNAKYLFLLIPIAGFYLIPFNSCSSDPLKENIKELYVDQKFDCTDLKKIESYLQMQKNVRKYDRFFNAGKLDKEKLLPYIAKTLKIAQPALQNCDPFVVSDPIAEKVNVFIENSGSMDGYVNGITDYESVLSDIIVEANHYYGKQNLSVSFITDKPYPAKISNINSFFKSLDPKKAPFNVGAKSVSELNELFRLVLDSTAKNDISIFVSDCIYSLDKSSSTINALVFQQNLTKAVFLDKSKEFPVSAYLIQLFSSFTGTYYDHNNNKVKLKNESRPYYIWILGEESLLKQFLSKIKPKQYRGFGNSYFMTANHVDHVAFELLASTNKLGRSRSHRQDKMTLEQVELVNNVFQFSFVANLSDYPDPDTFLDKGAYEITPGFELVSVRPIPEKNQPALVKGNDWTKISDKGYSHIFTVKTVMKNFPNDFHLAFVNKLPAWVSQYSTDDDSNMQNNKDKTFGLKYLVAGVQSAYETLHETKDNTFSINLKLNR